MADPAPEPEEVRAAHAFVRATAAAERRLGAAPSRAFAGDLALDFGVPESDEEDSDEATASSASTPIMHVLSPPVYGSIISAYLSDPVANPAARPLDTVRMDHVHPLSGVLTKAARSSAQLPCVNGYPRTAAFLSLMGEMRMSGDHEESGACCTVVSYGFLLHCKLELNMTRADYD